LKKQRRQITNKKSEGGVVPKGGTMGETRRLVSELRYQCGTERPPKDPSPTRKEKT